MESSLLDFMNERRYSMITEEFPSEEEFPLYYKARKREYVIHAGQKLRIPLGWFHMVFSDLDDRDEMNIALSFFEKQDPTFFREDREGVEEPRVEPSEFADGNFDFYKYIERDQKLRVSRSDDTGLVVSSTVGRRYPTMCEVIHKTLQEFLDDHDPKEYIVQADADTKDECKLWVNWGSVRTLLHYDAADNWLHQIQGRKRVVMFPPDDRHLLYTWNPVPMDFLDQINSWDYNNECV